MTPSIDQTLHQFANLLPNWTLLPILTLLPNFGGFGRTLQRVRLANIGHLLLRTPGPVPFGTCICSNVETILSWTCHVHGLFELWTSLGSSILLLKFVRINSSIKNNNNWTFVFHYMHLCSSKSRYGWKIAYTTLILNTTNQNQHAFVQPSRFWT